MDTLPIPTRTDAGQYHEHAVQLVTAASKYAEAVRQWSLAWLEELIRDEPAYADPFVKSSFERAFEAIEGKVAASDGKFALREAQHAIAHAHSFETWHDLVRHLDDPQASKFEAAVDAVVNGDVATLQNWLARYPDLVHARSARLHRATLLHYVAANGVEDFRQRTPANAVEIARVLLSAGAPVDALANTYGGGPVQTTLNLMLTSAHPAHAGLQAPLTHVLLDFGAAVNGLTADVTPLALVLHHTWPNRDQRRPAAAPVLLERGARIDDVVTAAGAGELPRVRELLPAATTKQQKLALVAACKFGHDDVARYLLDAGVDPASADIDDMTALHWAAATGSLELIRLLLERGAPLELQNRWGGSVPNSTEYFAEFMPVVGADYSAVRRVLTERV